MKRLLLYGTILALLSLLIALPALADAPKSMARAHLEPGGAVAQGQPVKLVVDALTTNWFTEAPVFPPLELPGAIVSPPGDDATNLSEDIQGVKWFGVSRTYIVTPQAGGDIAIPPLELKLQVGQVSGLVTVHTPALKLKVKAVPRPAGAENAIGTTRLDVTQSLDRDLRSLKEGDAFTRTIEISADGVQAMLLPPTPFAPVSGLAVYPKAPRVQDISQERQGFLGGRRVDAATYVVQRPGRYELPGVDVQWWDIRAGKLRTASVPPLRFSAAANPGYKPPVGIPGEPLAAATARHARLDPLRLAYWAAVLLVLALAAWLLLPRLIRALGRFRAWRRQRRLEFARSEAAAFARLRRAQRGRDPAELMGSLYAWLDRVARGAPAVLARPAALGNAERAAGSAAFASAAEQLLSSSYGATDGQGDAPAALGKALNEARAALAREPAGSGHREATPLPPLNPGSG